MKKKRAALLLLLVSISITAQIKGVVRDSVSGKPISYVNIWVANENIGTTSEENGEFTINESDKNKKLIFSALGFEKKILIASKAQVVNLKPIAYELDEVVISKSKNTKIIEIGKTKNDIYQSFDNGPRIDTKFFPYTAVYKKLKFIKKVSIETDSRIEDATLKIHFYSVDANGYPDKELLDKDFIVTVVKGTKKNSFDLSDFDLEMPKTGIFVGFEKLIIEKNRFQRTYSPFIMYNFVERDFLFTFSGGKWNKQTKQTKENVSAKMTVYEPAINLVLTN